MSYVGRNGYTPTAGTLDNIVSAVNLASKGVQAATVILEDPYFPKVAGLVLELHQLEQPKRPSAPGASVPAPKKGIGLNKVVKPLEMYVQFRRNPIAGYAIIAGVLAIPFLLGRASKRGAR